MIFPYYKRKVISPKFDELAEFLFFVLIYGLVNRYSQSVYKPGDFALRVKSFCISQVINQRGKTIGKLVRIFGIQVFILMPFIYIFFNKKRFTHLVKKFFSI